MDLRTDDGVDRPAQVRLNGSAGAGLDERRRWNRAYVAALLAVPWLLIVFDDSWLYAAPGTLDPWLYHGFMRNYPEYIGGLFPDLYYGTRLGWIVPGYVAYSLFPPALANLLLHVSFFYAAILATFALLARLSSQATAFVGAMMVAASPPMLVAIGWDYVDGPVIAYVLVALAAAIMAATAHSARSSAMWALASGGALACMLHTNAVSVLLTPAVPAALVVLAPDWRRRITLVTLVAVGGVLATGALAAVNVAAGGVWAFFMPSIEWVFTSSAVSVPRDLFQFPKVVSLVLPASALVALLASFVAKRSQRSDLAVGLPFLLAAVAMAAFDLLGGALLSTQFYLSWLVPLSLCVLAVLCLKGVERVGSVGVWLLAAVLVVAGAIGIQGGNAGRIGFEPARSRPLVAAWIVLGCALVPATIALAARRAGAFVLGGWVLVFAATTALSGRSMAIRPGPEGKDLFNAVDQVLRIVKTNDPVKRPLFWYGPSAIVNDFRSIASTHLYQYSLLGEDYPALPEGITAEERYRTRVLTGRRIAVLTTDAVDEARIRAQFAQQGVTVTLASTNQISAGRLQFLLTILDVVETSH